MNRDNSVTLGLNALIWILQDAGRTDRLIALTGLDPDHLRATADRPETLGAILGFLEAHQPDLIACADALDIGPQSLLDARRTLES